MPKRMRHEDDFFFSPESFSLVPGAENMCVSDCDTSWAFESDAEQMQMLVDFASTDIKIHDLPALQSLPMCDSRNLMTDLLPVQDWSASNDSSLSSISSSSPCRSPGSPSVEHACSRSETCLTVALRTQMTLHIAHSACLSAHQDAPTVQQARKMETVLSTNKDVVAKMGPILACSCSAKPHVQLLLLSICGNLIAWNNAMINADLEQGDDLFSPPGTPSQAPSARVLSQPITVGHHQISGKLGQVLRAQIIAGEIRILEGLVNDLSRRFCGSLESTSSTPPSTNVMHVNGHATSGPLLQSKGLSNHVHHHIISSLRTRLESTRAKIFFCGLGS